MSHRELGHRVTETPDLCAALTITAWFVLALSMYDDVSLLYDNAELSG